MAKNTRNQPEAVAPVNHGFVSGVATEVSETVRGAGRGARGGAKIGGIGFGALGGLISTPVVVITGSIGTIAGALGGAAILGLLGAPSLIGLGASALGALLFGIGGGVAAAAATIGIGAIAGGFLGGTTFGAIGTPLGLLKGLFYSGPKRIIHEKRAATEMDLQIKQANAEGAQYARDVQTKMIAQAQKEQAERAAFLENILRQGQQNQQPEPRALLPEKAESLAAKHKQDGPRTPLQRVEHEKAQPSGENLGMAQ